MRNPWRSGMDYTYPDHDMGVWIHRIEDSPKEYEIDPRKRLFRFAVDVIDLFTSIPHTQENDVVRFQLAKSATAMGAKYEESQRTNSPADVHYKMGIALQQARESAYWLQVMQRMDIGDPQKIGRLITESGQIQTLLETILREMSR